METWLQLIPITLNYCSSPRRHADTLQLLNMWPWPRSLSLSLSPLLVSSGGRTDSEINPSRRESPPASSSSHPYVPPPPSPVMHCWPPCVRQNGSSRVNIPAAQEKGKTHCSFVFHPHHFRHAFIFLMSHLPLEPTLETTCKLRSFFRSL